jgi:hypothetical protein
LAVAIERSSDGSEPLRPEPIRRLAHAEEWRVARASRLGSGTLACPSCDAPVVLGLSPAAPSDPMSCPFCHHMGAVRDFLSLESPSRPAHVEVRVVLRERRVGLKQHR